MAKVLIIGAGGVGGVVAHKCAQNPDVFGEILLGEPHQGQCDAIAARSPSCKGARSPPPRVDADESTETVALIRDFGPDC